ncbi:MAG: Mth938-like domain-containing protein [Alphaproteobacteria bacterium]
MAERGPANAAATAVRPSIEAYGGGGFRVAGARVEGGLLVSARGAWQWTATGLPGADLASLQPLLDADPGIELLLLGCGPSMAPVPGRLREGLRARGIRIEAMATGAACRTFNVLVGENRRVAAALLPA